MTTTLVASDLEGTLSAGEMWRAIGEYVKANGNGAAYRRFFLGRMPGLFVSKIGLADSQAFKNDWFVRLAQLFRGWREGQVAEMSTWVVEHTLWQQRRVAVINELLAHARSGARLAIVSGGYTPVVQAFTAKLRAAGAADVIDFSTPLRIDNGAYTGELAGEVCTGEVKAQRLRPYAERGELLAAYGDTYADIPMLNLAKTGIAVSPDRGLAAAARKNGWRLITPA
jgi:HAD superfamily phosphoserine phosphatase-like hydrolase